MNKKTTTAARAAAPKKTAKKKYVLKKQKPDLATAITVPKAGEKMKPRIVQLTDEEQKALQTYIRSQRGIARSKGVALALIEKHGKLAYNDCTLSPRQSVRYVFGNQLEAEIEAVNEKKKAARDAGACDAVTGATSIDFSDGKAKAKGRKGASK